MLIQIASGDNIAINKEEVTLEVKKLKNRKSPGPDDVLSNEMIKYGGNELINQLILLLQNVFAQLEIPSDWKVSTIIPVFKKGNKKRPREL